MSESLSRRKFLQVSSAAAWAAGTVPLSMRSAARPARGPYRGTFCFFSKAVPQLNWQELAKSAKAAGFGGIDLTVRSGRTRGAGARCRRPAQGGSGHPRGRLGSSHDHHGADQRRGPHGGADPQHRQQALHSLFEAWLLPLQIRRCPQRAGGGQPAIPWVGGAGGEVWGAGGVSQS